MKKVFTLLLLAALLPASSAFQWPSGQSKPVQLMLRKKRLGGGVLPTLDVDLIYGTSNPSTVGTAMTATIGGDSMSSNNCLPGNSSSGDGCYWNSPPDSNFAVGASQTGCPNLGPVTLNNGGPTYAAGALDYDSIAFTNASPGDIYWAFGLGSSILGSLSNYTVAYCYYTPLTASTLSTSVIDTSEHESGYIANVWAQLKVCPDGNMGWIVETSYPSAQSSYCLEPSSSLFPGAMLVSVNRNSTTQGLSVYGTESSCTSCTITGTAADYCYVNFSGGQLGYLELSGTNSIAGSLVVGIATNGSPWGSAPTSGTLANGPSNMGATCSGTGNFSGMTLGGLATLSIHNPTTGALIGQLLIADGYHSPAQFGDLNIGNGEDYSGTTTAYFGPVYFQWNNVQQDFFGAW